MSEKRVKAKELIEAFGSDEAMKIALMFCGRAAPSVSELEKHLTQSKREEQIRERYRNGASSLSLSQDYGVHQRTICRILKRK